MNLQIKLSSPFVISAAGFWLEHWRKRLDQKTRPCPKKRKRQKKSQAVSSSSTAVN